MGKRLVLKNVRILYAQLFEPRAFAPGDDPKYSTQILIPKKDTEQLKKLSNLIVQVTEEDLGKKARPAQKPYRDGDTDVSASDTTAGHIFFNASAKTAPQVVGRKLQPLTSHQIWSGCYVNVSVSIYGTSKGGPKICAGLNNVQLVKEGDRLDGRKSAEDEFEALDDDEDTLLEEFAVVE